MPATPHLPALPASHVQTNLLEHLHTAAVIAYKGHDSDAFAETVRVAGTRVATPPRPNRTTQRRYGQLYRARNFVKRFFNRVENFRRVATGLDEFAGNYLVFVSLACIFGALGRRLAKPCHREVCASLTSLELL